MLGNPTTPPVLPQLRRLTSTDSNLRLACGKDIETFVFDSSLSDDELSQWARQFRQNYCADSEIDQLRAGPNLSRKDYLNQLKFPSKTGFGPAVRSGDFTELLLADYFEYILGYSVPRLRWCTKDVTDESKKGCDIFGFKFYRVGSISPRDELVIIECKSKFTSQTEPPVQNAINGSSKDQIRIALSLNACVQRSLTIGKFEDLKSFQRFQNPIGNPFQSHYRAVAAICNSAYTDSEITLATSVGHSNSENLKVIVVKGDQLMDLVHALYEKAANEA